MTPIPLSAESYACSTRTTAMGLRCVEPRAISATEPAPSGITSFAAINLSYSSWWDAYLLHRFRTTSQPSPSTLSLSCMKICKRPMGCWLTTAFRKTVSWTDGILDFRLHLMYGPCNVEPKNYASIRTSARLAKQGLGVSSSPYSCCYHASIAETPP